MRLFSKFLKIAYAAVAGFWFLTLFIATALGQNQSGVPDKLVVGVMDLPPFAMKTPTGEWTGLSIELVQSVARELNTQIEFREFSRIDQFKDALTNGKVDLTPVAAITGELERIVDFSNPYYRSGSAIAVKATGGGNKLILLVERLFSMTALKVIVSLGLLWMIAGLLVWLFERQRGVDMFSDKFLQGLGNGMWWAAVTMTTVGYGDKAPKTAGGRIVAIVWMFASIVLISSFTATIATSLTVDELKGKVRGFSDLPSVRVGALADSQFLEHLAKNRISAISFKTLPEGLRALSGGTIDAFVHDEALLKYLIKTEHLGTLQILPDALKPYYVCMALPPGSSLREPLNRTLLKVMNKEVWRVLLDRYL